MKSAADHRKFQLGATAFVVVAIIILLVIAGAIRPSDVTRDWKDDERLIIRP